jgi:ABC-type nitrate/sulfonate/bicarbonate transport system substrate-binding protein
MKKIFLCFLFAALIFAPDPTLLRATDDPLVAGSGERVAKIALNEVTMVALLKGWLKEEFDKVGARAELVPCSVAVVPPLLDKGEVHIANSMHGFSLVQLLGGFDPVIVWQSTDIHPRTVMIVVLKDSPIKTLADLKGKTLGVPQWTCGYYGASEILRSGGVPLETKNNPGEVKYINLTEGGSIATVLLAGKVDAISTHPTGLAALYNKDLIRDISTAVPDGVFVHGDRIVYYSKPKWAKENPDLIRAFIKAQERAVVYIEAHPDEAARLAFRELRQPVEILQTQFKELGNQRLVSPETDYESAVEAFKAFQTLALSNQDGLVSEKRKPLTDEQVRRLIDKRFFKGGEFYPREDLPETKVHASSSATPADSKLASSAVK